MLSQTMQKTLEVHGDFITAHPEQFRFWLPLLRLLAKGKPVAPEELASASHRPLKEVQTFLPSSDARLDQEGEILALALSLVPTAHQFHLGEQALYTWCAFDTLAFPPLLGRTARVVSTCPVTGQEIRLSVTPEAIVDLEPASAVLSIRLPGEETDVCTIQADICDEGHFFVSHDVAAAWPSLHQSAVLLSVEEAAQIGRALVSTFRSLAGEQE